VFVVQLFQLKDSSSELVNDPALIHESDKDFISPAVYFLQSQDSGPVLVSSLILMQLILTFDRGFGSRTVSIPIASHIKFRDLMMQAE
jgi:hypothetical protein